MPRFKTTIHTSAGIITQELDAVSKEDAYNKASRQGTVLSVKKAINFNMGGLSFGERQIFLTRLGAMLASRVGESESLRIIESTFSGRIRVVARELLARLESGSDLPDAISSIGAPDFPETTAALISAGSKGTSTAEAVREANGFEREMATVRKGSRKGLMGAFITFLLSIVFIVGSVFWMLPAIMGSDMMSAGGGDAVDIGWVMTLTNITGYLMAAVLVIIVFLGFIGTIGKKLMPYTADKIISRIPIYKELMLAQRNYISFYGMSLLVNAGVRMESVLTLTYDLTTKGALKEDFRRARDELRLGKPWVMAMKTIHETDRAALFAAQDNKQTANALKAIADQYRDIYAQRIAFVVPLMQTLGSVFMVIAGVVMFGVTALPMLQMSSGIL